MKQILCLCFVLGFTIKYSAQQPQDSLQGFNLGNAVIEAHERGCNGSETRVYVTRAERRFITEKYKLNASVNVPLQNGKYQSSVIASAPCVDEDFEALITGSLVSAAWIAQVSNNFSATSVPCATSVITFSNNNALAQVAITPVLDAQCNNVAHSPLGGTKILQLNRGNFNTIPSRIIQTFSVTASNFIYQYAYKGVLNASGGHSCCEQPALFFKFYDCSGTPISSLTKNVLSSNCTSGNPDAAWWTTSSTGMYYTPNWVMHTLDLSPYIGSCITVEVMAVGCVYTAHDGYLYYDAVCSNSVAVPDILYSNGNVSAPSYSACPQTYTLSGLGGFSYQWQGPIASGVNGATVSAISPSVSGIYTLTASTGTVSYTQTVNLLIYSPPVLTVTASSSQVCFGSGAVLQAISPGVNTYSWSSGATSASATVFPVSNTGYTVITTNSLGCSSTGTTFITVLPVPNAMISASQLTTCVGGIFTLTASSNTTPVTYIWSTGATGPSITVSPTLTGNYSFTVADVNGCQQSNSSQIIVYPFPQLQLVSSANEICFLQQATLTAVGSSANTYIWPGMPWANGSQTVQLNNGQTLNYSVVATSSNGCSSYANITVTVHPLPTVTITSSSNVFCYGIPVTLYAQSNASVVSYQWKLGALTPTLGGPVYTGTPAAGATQFHVIITDTNGCVGSTNIYPQTTPVSGELYISASTTSICWGEYTNLSATGINLSSYFWSTNDSLAIISVQPSTSTTYTVKVKDTNGCELTDTVTVLVEACTGIKELGQKESIIVFPNPSKETFTIIGFKEEEFFVFNNLAKLIRTGFLEARNEYRSTISSLPAGVYYIRTDSKVFKVLVK